MDNRPSIDLLESNHTFPGIYQIKAIGMSDDDFEARVIETVRSELSTPSDLTHVVKATPGGRHVSLTLDVLVQNADQVRTIYDKLKDLKGVTLLL